MRTNQGRLAGGVVTLLILLANAGPAEAGTTLMSGPTRENLSPLPASLHTRLNALETGDRVSPDCDVQQRPQHAQDRRNPARRRGFRRFGWLWRSTRNIDIERTGAPRLFYLRSPLLAAVPDPENCAVEGATQALHDPAPCASLAVNPGHENAYSIAVTLPQLTAVSPADLAEHLRTRLERGESVTLQALGGAEIELNPARIQQIEARTCVGGGADG